MPDSPYLDTAPEDAGMMHQELIAKLGVPLGELWNLTELVADSRRTGRWDALVVDVEGLLAAEGTPLDHRAGPALDIDLLDRALDAQGEQVRPGDLVLVHTGWTRWFLDADVTLRAEVRDARRATGFRQSRELPEWLWDHQVALFATDTFAVEACPSCPTARISTPRRRTPG